MTVQVSLRNIALYDQCCPYFSPSDGKVNKETKGTLRDGYLKSICMYLSAMLGIHVISESLREISCPRKP